jgi:hypothetical protein
MTVALAARWQSALGAGSGLTYAPAWEWAFESVVLLVAEPRQERSLALGMELPWVLL